jgi:hypothetical protein
MSYCELIWIPIITLIFVKLFFNYIQLFCKEREKERERERERDLEREIERKRERKRERE